MRVLGIVLAIGFGFMTWMLAIGLGRGVAPVGGAADAPTLLLYWAPITGSALPLAMLRFVKGSHVSGAWMLALAPCLGLLNAIVGFSVFLSYRGPSLIAPGSIPLGVLIFCAIWQLPWLYAINSLRKELKDPDRNV